MLRIDGTCTAVITAYDKEGRINEDLQSELYLRQVNAGNHIVTSSTTGESATLTFEEQTRLLEIALDVRNTHKKGNPNSKILVIAGIGSNSTHEAISLTQVALSKGADAGLSVIPYYNKPNQEGHYEHQKAIAEVGLPIMLYNIPARCGGDGLLPKTILKLAKIENIVALKAADGVNNNLVEVLLNRPKGFTVLSGDDTLTHSMMSMGADGVVSVNSNMFPNEINEYIRNYHLNRETSLDRFKKLFPALSANMQYGNPATIKEGMYIFRKELGMPNFDIGFRLPMGRISSSNAKKLERILKPYFKPKEHTRSKKNGINSRFHPDSTTCTCDKNYLM